MSLEAGLRLISEAKTDQRQKPHLWSARHAGESLADESLLWSPTEMCAIFCPSESQTKVGLSPV